MVSLFDLSLRVGLTEIAEVQIGSLNQALGTNVTYSIAGIGGIATSAQVSRAVKLATARTINGTSFDGTSNITTAYWGTTRTITINGVSKSVNGSADVEWTLAEIDNGNPILVRNDLLNRSWFTDSGTGSRDFLFAIPSGWALGEFRVCVVYSNGVNRYYANWVPWSDMSVGSFGSGGSHGIGRSVGTGSIAYLYRTSTSNMGIRLPGSNDRHIKVWLEKIAPES